MGVYLRKCGSEEGKKKKKKYASKYIRKVRLITVELKRVVPYRGEQLTAERIFCTLFTPKILVLLTVE